MYKEIDGTLTITVNDWIEAGLTYKQFNHDSYRGFLNIFQRGTHGNTLIDVKSIKRPDRLRVLERAYGKVSESKAKSIFHIELDQNARSFFMNYRKPDGAPLEMKQVNEYVNRASMLNALRNGLEKQLEARAKAGRRLKKGEFWKLAADWYTVQSSNWPNPPLSSHRSLRRVFDNYINYGYESLIHGNLGNDAARKVSTSIESLLMALWRTNDKPFINTVHERYLEFVAGDKLLYDKTTGEEFNPEDFRHKGRALEISEATVWNYLKDVVNDTSVYMDRNGNFDYVNKRRPKQKRKMGQYTLSKISMDDVALSRKSVRGWVYKYMAVDVLSGYWFRPAYVVGKPNLDTVREAFRNMFCELEELGLPQPGELEVEHHLMADIDWLNEVFPFVRFAKSSTDKRAEHAIRQFKYGVSKREGHTRGRWYAKHEAYYTVRNKVHGDYVEPELQPQTIVADDLADIEKHNNSLHPLQKTYPGMTRKEVFLQNINPALKMIEPWSLYRYIGNETETTIYNNDYVRVQQVDFWMKDFNDLHRLKPNNTKVTAFWMPEKDGSINTVYVYQDGIYIGEAYNANNHRYNEFTIERTERDAENMLHQNKRMKRFDKFVKDHRENIPDLMIEKKENKEYLDQVPVDIIETEQPKGYETDELDEEIDWAAKAANSI